MMRRGAFTLVEMMVALAITGLLTVMMLRMFSDSSTIWKTQDDRLDTFREARAALQLMTREFATALPLPNATSPKWPAEYDAGWTDQFPVIALRNKQTRSTPGLPTEYYTAAYLLSSAPNEGRSDLCAIGYSLEWEPSLPQPTSSNPVASAPSPRNAYVLRRQLAQSDTTFARLAQTLPALPKAPFFGETAFSNLYSTSAPPSAAGVTAAPAPTTDSIATFIWDLEFSVAPPLSTAATPVPSSATPVPTPDSSKKGFYGNVLPGWIEIRFKALGSNAAQKLAGNPLITKTVWSTPSDLTYIRFILPSEQQFVSRVKLAR